MTKFVIPILVLAIVVVVAITSTTRDVPVDFRFINRGSVNTLDPAQMSYAEDLRLALALWEGLSTLDPVTLAPSEGVAYFPPQVSADKRVYTFSLRPDARWSNGDPVTVKDFVRGWRRAIEPGSSDVYSEFILLYIEGAESYGAWRTDFTALLGMLRQLQKGTAVSTSAARAALGSAAGRRFAWRHRIEVPDPAPEVPDPIWLSLIAELRRQEADWGRIADDLLDAHIAEMDKRWASVGIRAIDEHHLEVRLVRPTSYFLDMTSFITYSPVHESIELLRERYDGRPLTDAGLWSYDEQWTKPNYHRNGYPGLVTNGAYRLAEWDFKRRLLMAVNPGYWNAKAVRSKTIEVVDVEYRNTAWMLYDQGRVDMICELTMDYVPELVRQFREGKRDDIHVIPSFGTYYYTMNCRPSLWDGRPNPIARPGVRRALATAINKQEIVDHVERLGNPVATTLVPAGQIPGYISPAGLSYDPKRAREDLAAAGYPGGKGLPTIEILYNTGANHEVLAQAIARMWERELGVTCLLVGKETKTFSEDKVKGRFMVGRSGWFGDFNDPVTFLNLIRSTDGHNQAGFNDPKYDGLLDKAADELDPARRLELLSRAERYLMEEQVPLLPIYTYVSVFAWRPNVTGIYPNPRLQLPLHCIHVAR